MDEHGMTDYMRSAKYYIPMYSKIGGGMGKFYGNSKKELVETVQEKYMPWLKKVDLKNMIVGNN